MLRRIFCVGGEVVDCGSSVRSFCGQRSDLVMDVTSGSGVEIAIL